MNNLAVFYYKETFVVDSREVAEKVGKRHDHLLRDIDGYVQILSRSIDPKVGVNDFFIPATYQDGIGRTLPCYYLTRKGCDMVANDFNRIEGNAAGSGHPSANLRLYGELEHGDLQGLFVSGFL